MNLIDAIKTEKNFKRRSSNTWIENKFSATYGPNERHQYNFSEPDLLADDWEVTHSEVSIDSQSFDKSFETAWKEASHAEHHNSYEFFNALKISLKERLGLHNDD